VAGIASLLVVGAYVAALPHYSAWLHMWLALPHYWSLLHMWLLCFTILHHSLLALPHYWLLPSVLNSPVQVHQTSKPSLEKC
jgi:hypothetical protein